MLLCIDIGNTNITLGVYRGELLGPRWRLATNHERMPDEFILQVLGLLSLEGLSRGDLRRGRHRLRGAAPDRQVG
jgi:type III pantothenate kinase